VYADRYCWRGAMTSLKSMTPTLAGWIGITPAALYERQRALVRAGLLNPELGRGPGSGVRATPESVAMLLVAVLATDSLSETAQQTKTLANLQSRTKCLLTGKRTFARALAAVLASPETSRQVIYIEARRSAVWADAAIVYKPEPKMLGDFRSEFGRKLIGRIAGLSVRAELWLPFRRIADDFEAEAQAPKSSP
jgi:hypothetical protein